MKKSVISLLVILFGIVLFSSSLLWAEDAMKQTELKAQEIMKQAELKAQEIRKQAELEAQEIIKQAKLKVQQVLKQAETEKVTKQAEVEKVAKQAEVEKAAKQAEAAKVIAEAKKDNLTLAAELMAKKGLENYKQALDLCMGAVKKNPNSFKANWMAAKACRKYGMDAQELGLADWKDICKKIGKKGMAYAEKAIELKQKRVEGHYWYGMNVGIYADSVSILTALKEGLKNKTQDGFEATYKYDKNYDNGGPIAALGRFWFVLPWPLNDDDLSMKYYREFQKTKHFGIPDTIIPTVNFGELLIDSRKTRKEGIALLEKVSKTSKNKYWKNEAKKLLDDL